jgi:hypothetical protein
MAKPTLLHRAHPCPGEKALHREQLRRRHSAGLISVLLAVLLTPLVAGQVFALGTLDQEALPSLSSVAQLVSNMSQTFTAGLTGHLDTVALYASTSIYSSTLNVAITAVDGGGAPTGPDLATGSAPAPDGWTLIALTPAISVTAGTMYAIVVTAPTPFWSSAAAPYAGGMGNSGFGSSDLAFRTYVTVAPPEPPPIVALDVSYAVGTSQASQADSGVSVPAGSTVWHRITVGNGGTTALGGLTLTASASPLPSSCPAVPPSLGPGATWTCTFSQPAVAGTTMYRVDAKAGSASGWSVATVIGTVPAGPAGTAGTKLGLPAGPGTYTTATKVAALGHYVTWQASLGSAAAGKTVGVYASVKGSDGTWGAWTRLTGRTADASGHVLYSLREAAASWLSVRFSLDGLTFTNATQARWR